jgi:hypothetical protein
LDDEMIIPIVAILMPLVLVPSVIALKHRQRRREFEHRERMRSLELGVPLVQAQPWPAAAVAIALGLGAPASAFLFSWLAVLTARTDSEIFIGATFVGLAGVLSGARLALRLIPAGTAFRPSGTPAHAASNGKPSFDPDTFDVVGRRG